MTKYVRCTCRASYNVNIHMYTLYLTYIPLLKKNLSDWRLFCILYIYIIFIYNRDEISSTIRRNELLDILSSCLALSLSLSPVSSFLCRSYFATMVMTKGCGKRHGCEDRIVERVPKAPSPTNHSKGSALLPVPTVSILHSLRLPYGQFDLSFGILITIDFNTNTDNRFVVLTDTAVHCHVYLPSRCSLSLSLLHFYMK